MSDTLAGFVGFESPRISHDGSSVAVKMQISNAHDIDLAIPVREIPRLIEFFAVLNEYLSGEGLVGHDPAEGERIQPITLHGIGLSQDSDPNRTLLVLKLAGGNLWLSIDSKELAASLPGFSRTAQTLSADHTKPN